MTVGAGDLSVSGSSADLGVHAHPAASATHLSKTCVSVLAPLLDHVLINFFEALWVDRYELAQLAALVLAWRYDTRLERTLDVAARAWHRPRPASRPAPVDWTAAVEPVVNIAQARRRI